MVPKKDGTSRPCRDYRRLNERTVGDAYPIPHIHDFASGLAGCKIFSKVDLVKGYHQVPVRVQDIPKTAIATSFGLYEFTRMPFGLKNSAQPFQRLMDSVTGQLSGVFVYIDDVLVASPSVEQHEKDLRQLFSALRRLGLVLNTCKCEFGVREIEFLSHLIMAQGIKPLQGKVEAVRRFERPRSVKSLQCYLGLINFYRRFLPNIAEILRPLTDALAGAPRQLIWNEEMTAAFDASKERLAKATLLFHPAANTELRVHTDASSRAIAGAVHQVIDGHLQPLGFFSRRTTSAESRYSVYDMELQAVYSMIVKFRHILEGRQFRIYTYQKPLKRAFFKARDPMSNRQRNQVAKISEFATDVAHIPGLEKVVSDALSQQYDDGEQPAVVHSIVHALVDVDLREIVREQRPIDEKEPSLLQLRQVNFPGVDGPVVCHTSLRPRILVPEGRRREVFDKVNELAHPSGKATLARSYVWRGMRRDILGWARQCQACAASKVSRHVKPPVRPIPVPKGQFGHVHVDIVGPFPAEQGWRYLLTMIDITTRWPEVVPIGDMTAATVMQAFLDAWVARFGIPVTVTTDRGTQFTSETWKTAMRHLGVNVATTSAYHPQANGLVERLHRTLKGALRCAVRASLSWIQALP